MSYADSGGGSGAGTSYVVDHATLTEVANQLGTAGGDLDAVGGSRPSSDSSAFWRTTSPRPASDQI